MSLEKASFFRKLYSLQFASSLCSNDLQVHQINAGYGASINQIVRPLWAAHNQGRPFQMTKHWPGARWLYATNLTNHWNYCPTTDMNCYFLPLGACPPQPHYRLLLQDGDCGQFGPTDLFHGVSLLSWVVRTDVHDFFLLDGHYHKIVPNHFCVAYRLRVVDGRWAWLCDIFYIMNMICVPMMLFFSMHDS